MNKTASNARLKASLEELARFGCPVDSSVAVTEVENEKVEMEQTGGIHESHIFQLQNRRVACMTNIAVTNHRARTIDLIDVELRAPWDNSLFEWLTPVQVRLQGRAKRGSSYSAYQFPGEGGLQLEYREVINHDLLERKKLRGQHRLEGWLLGMGGFMPDNLVHGDWLEMPFTIIGADHAEYSATIRLWTERLLSLRKIVNARTSIFAKPAEETAMPPRDLFTTAPPASQLRASD